MTNFFFSEYKIKRPGRQDTEGEMFAKCTPSKGPVLKTDPFKLNVRETNSVKQ